MSLRTLNGRRLDRGLPQSAAVASLLAAKQSPLTLCIVTSHNYGQFLKQCLDSVRAQTLPFDDVLVVDDSSQDSTPQVAEQCGVPWLRVAHRNHSRAMNAGIASRPRTHFILCLDADDWIAADYHQRLRALFTAPNIGVAYGSLARFDSDTSNELGAIVPCREFDYWALRSRNYAGTPSLMRREVWEQCGGWVQMVNAPQDWVMWLRATRLGWRMASDEKAVLHYRRHATNMTMRKRDLDDAHEEVTRKGMTIAVLTLFSGRRWSLDRYFAEIAAQNWGGLHLVAVDNSGDPDFARALKVRLVDCGFPFTYVYEPRKAVDGMAADVLAASAESRRNNSFQISGHVGWLWAKARESMPNADLVWTVEDDIGLPPGTLATLVRQLMRNQKAAVVSATIQSRFIGTLLARPVGQAFTGEQVEAVAGTGFGCALFRRPSFDALAFRPCAEWGDRHFFAYDWAAGNDVRASGAEWLMARGVVCPHYEPDRVFLP
jgi:hypothetical protein